MNDRYNKWWLYEMRLYEKLRMIWVIRTGVGGSVGRRQVGASLPGLGLEALFAALAVGARGVVLTHALEVTVLEQALGGVEVTLTPARPESTHTCVRRPVSGAVCVCRASDWSFLHDLCFETEGDIFARPALIKRKRFDHVSSAMQYVTHDKNVLHTFKCVWITTSYVRKGQKNKGIHKHTSLDSSGELTGLIWLQSKHDLV